MIYRTPAPTQRDIDWRVKRLEVRPEAGYAFTKVARVDRRSKRHPGGLAVSIFYVNTGGGPELEAVADMLKREYPDIVDIEVVRGHSQLRPQVRAWFPAWRP